MAAPSPSTSSPVSSSSLPATSAGALGNLSLSNLSSLLSQQTLLNNEASLLQSGSLLGTALGNPASTSSPTGTGNQSSTESAVGYIAAALLVIAGIFFMAMGSPRTVRVITSGIARGGEPTPVEAAAAA